MYMNSIKDILMKIIEGCFTNVYTFALINGRDLATINININFILFNITYNPY